MRNILIIMILLLSSILFVPCLYSGEHPTKAEVVKFMDEAVQYAKENGKESLLAEIAKKDGLFTRGELYIAGWTGDYVLTQHCIKPHLVGKDISNLIDKNGVNIFKAYKEAIENGDGWCEYYWPNPVTKKIQKKYGYGVRLDENCLLTTGTYSNE